MPYIHFDESITATLAHFGLRKIYTPSEGCFDYMYMIENPNDYVGMQVNVTNLLLQLLNCFIVNLISTQAEIFNSESYYKFVTGKNRDEPLPDSRI